MSRAAAKRAGDRAEGAVIQIIDALESIPEENAHIDARTTAAIWPSEVPMVGLAVVETGTDVEIKSCAVIVTEAQDRGRFLFRKAQHTHLLEASGVYLFSVTPPHGSEPLALKFVTAAEIDAHVPSWHDLDGRETYGRLSWSRIFDEEEIHGVGGGRR